MTRELDPQLVAAAWDGVSDFLFYNPWANNLADELDNPRWEEAVTSIVKAAITAADAHRAPAVREAVIGLMSAQGNLIAAYYVEMSVRIDVLRQERDNARTHLLNLLGAQEGDDA